MWCVGENMTLQLKPVAHPYIITILHEEEMITREITEEQYDAVKLLFFMFKSPCILIQK